MKIINNPDQYIKEQLQLSLQTESAKTYLHNNKESEVKGFNDKNSDNQNIDLAYNDNYKNIIKTNANERSPQTSSDEN